jgi:hypothetical protein
MIDGILKSQFATVFWYHGLIVFLAQHQTLGSEAGRSPALVTSSRGRVVKDDTVRCRRCGAAIKKRDKAGDSPLGIVQRQLVKGYLKVESHFKLRVRQHL